MVLVDQFEELFRYEDYSGREEAEAFCGLLIAAANENVPIYVAITMRSEYLGACTLIDALPEVINRGLYLTPRMSREECRQAIVGPAEVCGFSIEDRLVNKLLNDLTDFAPWDAGGGHDQSRRLGRRADQLPLMQHVLNLLWQKARSRSEANIVLTLADYEAAGGLAGALDRHADDIAATVPADDADAIDPVFRGLVTGKTVADAVRRPTSVAELIELADGDRKSVLAVLDAFREAGVNFLTPGAPEKLADDSIIDISHESLIRQWRRLSRCLDEEAHSADAWQQLLSRAERYKAGAGGLLTGLDLDNLAAWWGKASPTAAWANRYGNNFAEAGKFLRDSQAAETERKRREEEEERQLIAAQEAASSGRRFKRLSFALAAALIVAFAAIGVAAWQWAKANDAAAVAVAEREAADAARKAAEQAAAAEAIARANAEAAAAQAVAAQQEADAQRAIAVAAAAEAETARADAEAAERAATAAREQADQIIDTSIAYFAKSLGDQVATIQDDRGQTGQLGYAGSLLSRLAADTRALDARGGVDTSFIDALRPAFVVQGALSTAHIPPLATSDAADATRWADPPGGPGLSALADWAGKSVRVADRTDRIVARHEIPALFWGAAGDTPFGATIGGDGQPLAVLADTSGQLWVAAGGTGAFAAVSDGAFGVTRIDDLYYVPKSGRLYVAYQGTSEGDEDRGAKPMIAAIAKDGDGWRGVKALTLPTRATGEKFVGAEAAAPVSFAGVSGAAIYAVIDGVVEKGDFATGGSSPMDTSGSVIDARLTADGRYLLAGGSRGDDGTCATPSENKSRPRGGQESFRKALAAANPDSGGQENDATSLGPVAIATPGCLTLVDTATGELLWRGEAGSPRLDTARAVTGSDGVELIEGRNGNDLAVRRIAYSDDGWTDTIAAFDPADWGLTGFNDTYAAMAAEGIAYPADLNWAGADQRTKDGLVHPIARPDGGGRVIAWRVGGDEVQIARAVRDEGADVSGGQTSAETGMEVLVYRPEAGGFVKDDRFDTRRVACLPPGGDAACRFDAAAFSPNGDWLLVTSNGSHVFVGRDGMSGSWEANAPAESADANVASVTLAGLSPLDADGRSFIGRSTVDGTLRRISRPTSAVQPQPIPEDRFRQSPRNPESQAGDVGGKGGEGSGGTGGAGGSGATVVTAVNLPGHIESDLAGFATDPARSTLYVWGPRMGLIAIQNGDGDLLTADVEFDTPIADVAPMTNGDVVVATTDGRLMVVGAERFKRSGADAGGTSPPPPPSVATGLGSFGSIDVWAGDGRVVANAGKAMVDGAEVDAADVAEAGAGVDVTRLRSLGYRVDGDGRLEPTFVVPWDHITAELPDGEGLSVDSGGEIVAEPAPLPADSKLLALAIMREEQTTQETPEFEIGFDMLHMRVMGSGAGEGAAVADCGWILGVAVRMTGELQQNIGEDVKRACDEPASTAPIINAIFDDRADQRIAALLRVAPTSPLGLAVLTASLRPVAPMAAEALTKFDRAAAQDQWEATLAGIAENGPEPLRPLDPASAGFDPFAHWIVAMEAERAATDAAAFAEALYHYAYAERLFQSAHVRPPPQIVKRRIALARILSDDLVFGVFERLDKAPVDPAAAGLPAETVEVASLDAVSDWLKQVGAGAPNAAKSLGVLNALVEEAKGDELAATDPRAAAGHYRVALAIVVSADESLAEHSGAVGRIGKVEELGEKLARVDEPSASAEAAVAALGILDKALTEPVKRDVDPPELRTAIVKALTILAGAGDAGYDLSTLRGLKLGFLDYDWESRYQAINQVTAGRYYSELEAAEKFATTALDHAGPEDRGHWLALRGSLRFWLSTLEGEDVADVDPGVFRQYLDGAIADYAEAGGPDQVGLWDATIIGGAYSKMIEIAPAGADVSDYVEKSNAAYKNAMARDEFLDLDDYRRRLTYDGAMLSLERAMIRLRDDAFLSGIGAQPGEPGYDEKHLADLGYAALDLARRREALRDEAEVNGLVQTNTTWSLDTLGDFYWGATVAQLGGLLRLEDGANGKPTQCDVLGAHPFDVTRPAKAVDYDALDADRVLTACAGETPRDQYYQARAYAKSGGASNEEIMRLLLPSAKDGLPISYNNLSLMVSDAGGTTEDAQDLVSTFSFLSLIKAYPEIARLLKDNENTATRAETFEWLARKAAALDVPEAYLDIADLTPDILTKALQLTIGRNLFTSAGRTAEAGAVQATLDALNLSRSNVATLDSEVDGRPRIAVHLIDDAIEAKLTSLLSDARSQASLQ